VSVEDISDAKPLSFGQDRLWWLQELDPGSVGYNIVLALEFSSGVVKPALIAALAELVDRHRILRTSFPVDEAGVPGQLVTDDFEVPLVWLTAGATGDLKAIADEAAGRPFALAAAPPIRGTVVRLDSGPDALILVMHHILTDGWSLRILQRDLAALYAGALSARTAELPSVPTQFADFAVAQRGLAGQAGVAAQVEYWRDELAGFERLDLPTDRPRPTAGDFAGDFVLFGLSAQDTNALKDFALRQRCAVPSVVAAVFQFLLSMYSGQSDITIGTVFTGRDRPELNEVVGFFANTTALRVDLAAVRDVRELVRLVHSKMTSAQAHQDASFDQVVAAVQPAREPGRNPVFDVIFVNQGERRTAGSADPGLDSMRRIPWVDPVVRFDLEFTTSVVDGQLGCRLGYRNDLFRRSTIESLCHRFTEIIRQILADARLEIGQIDVSTPEERRRVLLEWNGAERAIPGACLADLFEEQAARTPDEPAVEFGTVSMTYAHLNARANRLARHLISLGAGPEDVIAFALPRSPDLIVGLLAAVKAGAAFLCLDVEYPNERIAFMVEDARPLVVLTTSEHRAKLPGHQAGLLVLADTAAVVAAVAGQPGTNVSDGERARSLSVSNAAYVIYTSGSTGRPKAVVVSHAGLASMLDTQLEAFEVDATSRVLQLSSPSFDASVWELCMGLLTGAALILAPADQRAGAQLSALLADQHVTHATIPPAVLATMSPETVPQDMTLIVAGEAVSSDLVEQWSAGRRMFNAYGPTESTVDATLWDCAGPWDVGRVPIGRPIVNTRVYVVDASLRLVAPGVAGELYIAGAGLARGYLNQPALTAQRFVANPFAPAGQRMYRTGDIARWNTNGELEFLGRSDDQLKIRGFRIEPGEIEALLTRHPHVTQAAVIAREDQPGHKHLIAYIVTADPHTLDPTELRRYTAASLPDHMVPTAIIELDRLPLTPNGKLDRQALPAPEFTTSTTSRPPRTPREEILYTLFTETLGLHHIGIDDGFFDLGGHSLLATRLISRIRTTLHTEITLRTLFETPTIAGLAQRLGGDQADSFATLLPLRTTGRLDPIFLIHPAGGLSWCYSRLLPYIPSEHPVYGLQSSGYIQAGRKPASLREMARDYLALIRRLQPQGPYSLMGWSFGGVAAQEMAVALEDLGEAVRTLVLFDALPMVGTRPTAADDLPAGLLELIEESIRGAGGDGLSELSQPRIAELSVIARHCVGLLQTHDSRVFSGTIVSIEAESSRELRARAEIAWADLALGGVVIHQVGCSHHEIMSAAPVRQIGPILRSLLTAPAPAKDKEI